MSDDFCATFDCCCFCAKKSGFCSCSETPKNMRCTNFLTKQPQGTAVGMSIVWFPNVCFLKKLVWCGIDCDICMHVVCT